MLRRQRAGERAVLVSRWAQQHHNSVSSRVPATIVSVVEPTTCDACGRRVGGGRVLEMASAVGDHQPQAGDRLCLACGRRALLEWADQRRSEAVEARRLAQSLGEPISPVRASPARAA